MRLLSLIAVMLAACAVAVYAGINFAADKPKEPVHPIVGKWKLVNLSGHAVSPELDSTVEYFADGTLVWESTDPLYGIYGYQTGTRPYLYYPRNGRMIYPAFSGLKEVEFSCFALDNGLFNSVYTHNMKNEHSIHVKVR